jgi:ubiquitin-protein ligase
MNIDSILMAVKRAVADVKELQSILYKQGGIFYALDESNVLYGSACIFGPKDTPYEDCPMLYTVQIPQSYPFEPPKLKFTTYDGSTRFHPNMYKEGKVCLSILGTWEGEKWSSVMRLSTVLVTLQSLMDTNPLQHEPMYAKQNTSKHKLYAKYIEFRCICYIVSCIEYYYKHDRLPDELECFRTEFLERMPGSLDRLGVRLAELKVGGEIQFADLPYGLSGTTQYGAYYDRVVKLKAVQNAS